MFIRTLMLTAAMAGAMLAPTHAQTLTRADVEAIVQQYIDEHGDKVLEGITKAQQRKQLARATSAITAYTPTRGPANAAVTIIEFSDFECPFCSRVQPTITSLQKRYEGRVRWAFKHLPLEFHAKARPAAYAAMAAAKQGKFWEYSAMLWASQAYYGDALYTQIASKLKLNMKKFNADRASAEIKGQIDRDLADAAAIGAQGTPFFLINGQPISGALPEDEFIKAIEAAIAQSKTKKK